MLLGDYLNQVEVQDQESYHYSIFKSWQVQQTTSMNLILKIKKKIKKNKIKKTSMNLTSMGKVDLVLCTESWLLFQSFLSNNLNIYLVNDWMFVCWEILRWAKQQSKKTSQFLIIIKLFYIFYFILFIEILLVYQETMEQSSLSLVLQSKQSFLMTSTK